MSPELSGWLLCVYPDEQDGAVLWLIGEDGGRYRLTQPFKTSFFLAGRDFSRLHAVYRYLREWENPPEMVYTFKWDLFKGMRLVLKIEVGNPVHQERLFYNLKRQFKGVQYYNAKIPFSVRYGAEMGVFPMAKCRLRLDEKGQVESITALDSPWDLSYKLPEMRQLLIDPDTDPKFAHPGCLTVRAGDMQRQIETRDERALLDEIKAILEDYDPDVIQAAYGDAWLFPYLARIAAEQGITFNPNRDKARQALIKDELSYHSYGQVHYRASQTLLFGRWLVDPRNAAMSGGFSLHAAIEMARVSGVDVQVAARNSPGAGFTAMQMRQALHWGGLVPLKKRQTEPFRPAMDLNNSDGGGLNYRPVVGLHRHVAELDFFSMYPSIMARWNISGETAGEAAADACTFYVPQSQLPIRQNTPGLVASILAPLLQKRRQAKEMLRQLTSDNPLFERLKGTVDGLKWLGYVSFGYQGHAHNLFGRILAHEAICALGREMLVRSIEAAHDYGFEVMAANTDSIFVCKPSATQPEDFQALIDEIHTRTGLMIELEGVFQWLAFLPSKLNPRIGASNRYFGKFQAGGLKVRGMAQRRADTPIWVADAEREIMTMLAEEEDTDRLQDCIPGALEIATRYLAELYAEQVPKEDLITRKRLSREPADYKGKSEAAKAARQLRAVGIDVRVGQRIPMIYVVGERPGVMAWGLSDEPKWGQIEKSRYRTLLIRSLHQVLQPWGLSEKDLTSLLIGGGRQLELWPEDLAHDIFDDYPSLADDLFGPYLGSIV
jgi:DNA polymerase II